ncbi:MAG TPA: A24 family peptidase [Rhodoglobus sp.]|nr:A24 family peptidase [Rhodoglobus sp.]
MSGAASSRTLSTRWWRLPAAAVFAAIALVAVGPDPRALPLVYLAAVTPTLCAVDALERRLPNSLVLPGYLVAAAGIVAHWIVSGEFSTVAVVSGVLYFVVMLAFAVAGGMGMGDVKLAGVLGLSAGLVSATAAVVSPLVAFVLGGIAAIGALRGGRGASIPFGPFLLAGFWVAVVVG